MPEIVRDGGRSPPYEAHHAPRYERQELIRQYQKRYKCRLVAVSNILIARSLAPWPQTEVSEIRRQAQAGCGPTPSPQISK